MQSPISSIRELTNSLSSLQSDVVLQDHMDGFTADFSNAMLKLLNEYAADNNQHYTVYQSYILTPEVKQLYPNLTLRFKCVHRYVYESLKDYNMHPELSFKNFLTCFNGSAHVGRKLLVAALYNFGYYNPLYCSKNFSFTRDEIDGHIQDYTGSRTNFYNKFFLDNNENFFQTINSFGYVAVDHARNIFNLESQLTDSFLHIASETRATSYYPFFTEKFLYSIVTRGLFLSYAQPCWHEHLERYCGFKLYQNIFDYRFDAITNPVERLLEMMCMLSKFKNLSTLDWHDLYQLETDNIKFNYDHYHSGNFIRQLDSND